MLFEIILVVIGIGLVIAGYAIPAKKEEDNFSSISREEVENMVSEEVESAKGRIDDIVDETINYAIEKTERSMDRLSNEKMMAVSEYSDTVLDQINKSHEEVVFLYDMLNDKHENLKETVAEAERTAVNVRESINEAKVQETAVRAAKNEAAAELKNITDQSERNVMPDDKESTVRKPVRNKKAVKPVDSEKTDDENEGSGGFEELAPALIRNVKDVDEPRKRNKPVPVIKNETLFTPLVGADNVEERDDYYEEEWESLDDPDEMDGPELSFNVHSPGSRNSNDRILELHKAGKSNMAIAKELGLGIGEVKLVIDLFKGQ